MVVVGSEVPASGAVLDAMLHLPNVVAIEANRDQLMSWGAWQGEVLRLTRRCSAAFRAGATAVLYLQASHEADGATSEIHHRTGSAIGRVLRCVADAPAYLAVLGSDTANTMLAADTEVIDMVAQAEIAPGVPLHSLGASAVFPGLPVAICSAASDAAVLAQVVDALEACRF